MQNFLNVAQLWWMLWSSVVLIFVYDIINLLRNGSQFPIKVSTLHWTTGELNLEARLWWHIMSILRWSKCTSIPETLKSLLMNNPGCSCHCQKKNIIHLCIFTNPLFAIFPGNNLNVFFCKFKTSIIHYIPKLIDSAFSCII